MSVKKARDSNTAVCGDPRIATLLLRAWHPGVYDHFYTTNAVEMRNAVNGSGYIGEGAAGYVFDCAQPATVPLYRLYHPQDHDHFYTTDAGERDNAIQRLGYKDEGVVGYVYPDKRCGLLELYRSYNGFGKDHFYTMSAQDRDGAGTIGWHYEGVTAYIFPF
jgi:hypothetical protein